MCNLCVITYSYHVKIRQISLKEKRWKKKSSHLSPVSNCQVARVVHLHIGPRLQGLKNLRLAICRSQDRPRLMQNFV